MSEDVAGSVRMGIMMVLLSALVTAVVNLTVIGMMAMNGFTTQYVTAANTADRSVLSAINQVPDINAATAYRMIEERLGNVESLSIRFLNGVTTSDHMTLLETADKTVTVSVEVTEAGTYKIIVQEVDR